MGGRAATELRARGLSSVRTDETRVLIQALRDENARLRALSMPQPWVPSVPYVDGGGGGGGVSGGGGDSGGGGGGRRGGGVKGLALPMTVAVPGDSKEAVGAAETALGGVLNGVAYPCSPGARSYCDGEVELEHEIEAEAEVGAVGGATGLPRRYPPQDTCAPPLIAAPPSHCHALPLPPLSLSMCAEDADVALGSHSASYTLAERDLPLSPYSPLPSAFPPGMRRSSSDATGVGVQSVCMNGLALALEAKQFLALTIACCVVSVRF